MQKGEKILFFTEYKTITKALEILDGDAPQTREDAKQKYDAYVKAGQIEFVTFHQSYGYILPQKN